MLDIQGENSHLWYYRNLGEVLAEMSDFSTASLGDKILQKSDSWWYFSFLGDALVKQGNVEAAFDFYQRAISLKPDLIELYYKLLKVKPNSVEIYLKLSGVLSEQQRFNEAMVARNIARRLTQT